MNAQTLDEFLVKQDRTDQQYIDGVVDSWNEWRLRFDDFRDVVLNQRGLLAENGMTSDQINDILNTLDNIIGY